MTFAADILMSKDNHETLEDSNSSGLIDYMEEAVQQAGHFGIADQIATIGAIDNVSQVREKINNLKSQTQAYRAIITSQQNQAFLDDNSVVEYADNILEILKCCKDILEVTFKEISDLEKRLLLLKMFLEFITTLGVEGEKLQDLLIGIISVLDTATLISDQCFLIGGESEMVNVIKDCMAKARFIDSEVIDLLLKSLKSTSSASEFDMIVRIADEILIFLQDVLRVTLNHGADMNNQVKDDEIHLELEFLESFLSNKSSQYIEHVKSISSHVEVVFTAHAPKLFSIGELDYLSELSKDLKLIKAEVRILEHLDNTMEPQIKDQTETLLEGLVFMRNYLMSHKMKQIYCSDFSLYKHIEEMAFKGESIISSIIDNGVKEDLVGMLEDIKHLKIRASGIYLEPTTLKFPRVNQKAFLDSFLQYLKEDVIPTSNKVALVKRQVMAIHSSLESLKTSFSHAIELYNEHDEEFKAIKSRVVDAVFEAEYTIDSFLVRQHHLWYHMLELFQVTEKIQSIDSRIEIFNKNWEAEDRSTQQMSTHVLPEVNQGKVVGVENEVKEIVEKLANGKKEHHVISIVGMPKLGKTALAKAVYYNERFLNHFDVRAWCDLSGVNTKRNLLMGLLNQVGMRAQIRDFYDDGDLAQFLKKSLWGRRYLIVMDDLQDIEIWEYFQRVFHKENNGSGIIFTTRFHGLVSKLSDQTIKFVHLGFIPTSISWMLLKNKIFDNDCSGKLEEIGMRIAERCYGIPFAIHLAVETLRMMEKNPDRWGEEEERLFSQNITYLNDNILEPSYKDLPEKLKSCFLYWGPIIKSETIPIKKLIWLSIAEKLVQQTTNKSLEDQANDLLLELQTSEVLVVAQQIFNGRIKKCNIVEQFSEFCLKKCREEHIWELINGRDADTKSKQEPYTQCRLYIHSNGRHFLMSKPSGSHVRSLIFGVEDKLIMDCDVTCITNNFRLLRVLDFGSINVGNSFPREIELMILLKYLAIHGNFDSIPESVSNLGDLETFLIKGSKAGSEAVGLPHTVQHMRKLRHLHIYPHAVFLPGPNYHGQKSLMLSMESDLQTISALPLVYDVGSTWTEKEHMQKWLGNVRNLKFVVADSSSTLEKCNLFPSLLYLNKLESLKICCTHRVVSSSDFSFPQSLKRLTLSNLALPWDEISIIGRLPQLEVLKLLCNAFKGSKWEMKDDKFPRLKYLKLDSVDIQQWIGDDEDCLPHLEWLALRSCEQLEMIPSCITNNFNLQTIEFWGCSDSIKNLAKKINEERVDVGCEQLIKVVDHPHRA
ncbi:putative late blight resistance protein homolog R1A-3 [Ipomoea triloba]|uniref:putative late blight resistance protein homolog R1A-3 n=1 Tax=Ipomoea triloba TaxID=35885 RepID=UPI00125D3105|nr:putative late blight resistance protein homolog R1A-3 [Ipomoea triloba]